MEMWAVKQYVKIVKHLVSALDCLQEEEHAYLAALLPVLVTTIKKIIPAGLKNMSSVVMAYALVKEIGLRFDPKVTCYSGWLLPSIQSMFQCNLYPGVGIIAICDSYILLIYSIHMYVCMYVTCMLAQNVNVTLLFYDPSSINHRQHCSTSAPFSSSVSDACCFVSTLAQQHFTVEIDSVCDCTCLSMKLNLNTYLGFLSSR